MKQDYYETLGVNRDASEADIKKQYRKLAMEHHPDKGGDAEKFKSIAEAYEHLSDPQKKQQYDSGGRNPFQGGGFHGFDMNDIFGGGHPFGDFFSGFGQQRQQQRVRKGQSVRIKIKVTLEDILHGSRKKVKVDRQVLCKHCNGSGSKDGKQTTCTTCNGSGSVMSVQNSPFGQVRTQSTCPTCNGTGSIIKDPCAHCKGHGLVLFNDVIDIDIPAGVVHGMTLQMGNKGNEVYNGVSGDLIILVEEIKHETLIRDEYDLVCKTSIGITDAILGGTSDIDTLEGKIRINIEPGTQHGKVLRIKGKGLPHFNSMYKGDLRVEIEIKIPKEVPEDVKKTLESLRNIKDF